MEISFYEEFPIKENLLKLRLIKFPTKLFLAAKSFKEFKILEKEVKKINKNIECVYWPIIKNSYWISPFSNTNDLIDLFSELDRYKNHLLIDLELPLKKRLILKNFFRYIKNKELIQSFLEKNKNRITTAQYPLNMINILMRIFGLDYNIDYEKSFMWYSSILPGKLNNRIKKSLTRLLVTDKTSISLGTIAKGILSNEMILSPTKLKEDLEFVKDAGFKKVILFRLGGLNKEYIKVIDRFT